MIRNSILKEGNRYINIPELRKFFRDNNLENFSTRSEGIKKLKDYYNSSDNAKEKVNCWLDKILKEGIKYVYIKKFLWNQDETKYSTDLFWEMFKKKNGVEKFVHCNEANCGNTLEYRNIETVKGSNNSVKQVNIFMSFYVMEFQTPTSINKEFYPIFVEIDVINKIIQIRIKSRSKIYRRKEEPDLMDQVNFENKVTNDKVVKEVYNKIIGDLNLNSYDSGRYREEVFYSYYKLLDDITKTPPEIQEIINTTSELQDKCIRELLAQSNVPIEYLEMAKKDLNVLMEKFISISYPDKEIFKKNEFGYPIKLIATDSENTKLEETAAALSPLQGKGAFYDHKKIISEEKKCDGISLAVKRLDTLYYGTDPFVVKCDYNKEYARIRFDEYVVEGDMQNVLSRITSNL